MAPGTVIVMDLEATRITAHDEDTRTLTVTRALYGTEDVVHLVTTLIQVAPNWPRYAVFDSIADEIEALASHDLYHTGELVMWPAESVLEVEATENIVAILEATQLVGAEYLGIEAKIVRNSDIPTGVGIQIIARSAVSQAWIRYSRSFDRPTAEDETLADLGVDTSWERLIIFGALSTLMLIPDIDAVTQEFITESLEAQGFPATTGTSLAIQLSRLRQNEVAKAADRLISRDGVRQSYYSEVL